MTAGVAALRNDHISPCVARGAGLRDALHLRNQDCAGGVNTRYIGCDVAKRQQHRARLRSQRQIEQAWHLVEAPGDKADTDSRLLGRRQFRTQPFRVTVATANQTETTRARHSRREPTAGNIRHRRQQQGLCNAQTRTECGLNRHMRITHRASALLERR